MPRLSRQIAAVLALATSLLGPVPSAPAEPAGQGASLDGADYHRVLQEARGAAATGDMERALEAWQRLVEARPENGEAWLGLAQAAVATGRFPRALEAAERVLDLGTRRPAGLAYRAATAYARAGRPQEALRMLRRALELGFEDRPSIWTDPAFAPLRDDPELRTLAARPAVESLGRVAGWRADLEIFAAEARRLHAAPRSPARGESFGRAVDELARRVPDLDDAAIVLELERLIAGLGDGHSQLRGRGGPRIDAAEIDLTLPARWHRFADGIYVIAATPEHADLLGSRVQTVGGLPVEAARQAVAPYLSRDNDTWIDVYGLESLLVRPAYLAAAGSLEDARSVEVGIIDSSGEPRTVELTAGDHDLAGWPRLADDARGPAFLARRHTPHHLTELPDLRAAYLILDAVADAEDGPTLAQRAGELRTAVGQGDLENVVLDLRLNGGGDQSLLAPLLRTLVWFQESDADHRIFVITGPRTFSAAQNLATRIERLTDAVFVGRPTGSSPNFVGEVSRVLLPWSGLRLSIASRYWQDSDPLDHRPWIFPDVPVHMTHREWLQGVDPALREIRRVLAGG